MSSSAFVVYRQQRFLRFEVYYRHLPNWNVDDSSYTPIDRSVTVGHILSYYCSPLMMSGLWRNGTNTCRLLLHLYKPVILRFTSLFFFFFFYLNSHHHLILSVFDTHPPPANVRRAHRPLYLLCFLDFGRPCSIPAAQEAESLVNLIKILCETLVHSIMPYRHWQLPIQFMTSTSSSRVEWTALSSRTAGWRELRAGGMRSYRGKVMCTRT